MRCGLCLPTCPTYAITGLEKSSPRGRIRLMKAVVQGEIDLTRGFVEEMNFCLDCQACESACPAGVKYGWLVESARVYIAERGFDSLPTKAIKWLMLKKLFEKPSLFAFVARILRIIQVSGLLDFLQKSKVLSIFSKRLQGSLSLLPRISERPSSQLLSKVDHSTPNPKFRVGFITGCIMDVMFADINMDTVELLELHGCDVIVPSGQCCCGSLQAHNGDFATARRLAAQNIRAFSGQKLDAIVMNSAGCGAFMKQYGSLFEDDEELSATATELAGRTKDISEFMFQIGLKVNRNSELSRRPRRVTYHDACHLVHSQKISDQPRHLIKSIPSVQYVELPEASWCCGSAGIYNITHFDTATQLLERKVENIRNVAPDIVVTGNPGCLVQLQYGLDKAGLHAELLHLATFLKRACCG